MCKSIVYVGDFDFRNENVQAHLVKNNGKIFNALGYSVEYIGINREVSSFKELSSLPQYAISGENDYFELPNTLNFSGMLKTSKISKLIIDKLNETKNSQGVSCVITYQSPSYAVVVQKIAKWCKRNGVKYIVNSADLPIFDVQSTIRRVVMKINWDKLHKVNHKNADGIIAVSSFIEEFYKKEGRPSVIIPPLFDCESFREEITPNVICNFVYAGTPFKLTGREADPKGMKDRLDKIIDLFLELTSQGIKYRFDIVGVTKEEYVAGVPRHASAVNDESNIRFWGKKSHEETLRMIESADFSINYRDENLMTRAGFSTKIVESVSLGTPVIINPISDTFRYLEEGSDGFALCDDFEKNAEKLKFICELSHDVRFKTKQNLLEKKTFDITSHVNAMASFLHSVI